MWEYKKKELDPKWTQEFCWRNKEVSFYRLLCLDFNHLGRDPVTSAHFCKRPHKNYMNYGVKDCTDVH